MQNLPHRELLYPGVHRKGPDHLRTADVTTKETRGLVLASTGHI
jgi:hypothetical protein